MGFFHRPGGYWQTGITCLALLVGLLVPALARSETPPAEAAVGPGIPALPVAAASRSSGIPPAARRGAYGRLGIGFEWPRNSRYSDTNCAATDPPALFGCASGEDGRRLGAYGDFAQTLVPDVAIGYRLNDWLRAEALLSWRVGTDFRGQSNFTGAGVSQPVSGSVASVTGFGVAYLDLPRIGKVRPFFGAGLGVSRNRMGAMTYAFPALAGSATTTTLGGTSSHRAYLLVAGLSVPLGDRLDLDLAYRRTDLGQLQTDSGEAEIVRARGTRSLVIGGTKAALRSDGVMVSLRYAL
jgi:opacity protein-like surface antigen